MNIAKQITNDMHEARKQVVALCNFTDEELNQLQWDAAIQCLEKVLQSDEFGIAELPKTSAFWAWWREQWYRRDMQFINALSFDCVLMKHTCALPAEKTRVVTESESSRRGMYMMYHRMTASNPLVNNSNMEVSFHYLVRELALNK